MKFQLNRFIFATVLYLTVCMLTVVIIEPFSLLSFIGPAAGMAVAITIAWGALAFASITLATLLFALFLASYIDLPFEPAVFIIATLAIILQAYSARMFTYRFLPKQKWLNNRASLVNFILIVGPATAPISAIAAVIMSLLDTQSFEVVPVYTFVVSYAGCTLVAIFTTPILLFTHGKQKLALSKRLYITMVSVLVCVAIALLFKVSQQQNQYQRVDSFRQQKNDLLAQVKPEITSIENQLTTLAAFFKTSEFVSAKEFSGFADSLFKQSASLIAVEWVPAVSQNNKEVFEQIASEQLKKNYLLIERSEQGTVQKVTERDMYMPIYYIYPQGNDGIYGYDLLVHDAQKVAMNMAAKLTMPVATPPQELVESDFYQPKMRVYYPVYHHQIKHSFGRYQTELDNDIAGFIVAQVQFTQFFKQLAMESAEYNIDLVVEDISVNDPFFIYGDHVSSLNRLSESISIDFFSRHWKISLYEKVVWLIQDKSWQTWTVLLGGTFSAILFQLLFLMVAVYSNELTFKVNRQTKQLIADKEQAEKENLAKTQFLQNLSSELTTPFNVIKKLTETFPQNGLGEQGKQYLNNISAASFNLGRLIDTLSELSTIDSGKLNLSQQPFNFVEFLNRMHSTINLGKSAVADKVNINIASNAPLFINSDELRLQQLFIALAENAEEILSCKGLAISVKAHFHLHDMATIFFVFTPPQEQLEQDQDKVVYSAFDKEISQFNTRVAMVQELCVLFGGDLTLARLPSGSMMISASIKVAVHQFTQHNEGSNFISSKSQENTKNKHIVLVRNQALSDDSVWQKLSALGYQVDLLEEGQDINFLLNQRHYDAVIFDQSLAVSEMLVISQMLRDTRQSSGTSIIAILSVELSADMIKQLKNYISTFAFSSISKDALQQLLLKNLGV